MGMHWSIAHSGLAIACVSFGICLPENTYADGPFVFATPTTIVFETPHFPAMVAAGDLDGDGDQDLVVPGRNSDGLAYIALNQGGGTFSTPIQLDLGSQSDWVEISDVDDDGVPDLVFALRSFQGRALILWGIGDGTFEKDITELKLRREPRCIAIADLNGNGQKDIAAINYGSSEVQILFNQGNRSFGEEVYVSVGHEEVGSTSLQEVAVGDLDGDGDHDLAMISIASSKLYFMRNRGDGTFEKPVGWSAPRINSERGGVTSLALVDIDGDDDLDATVPLIFIGTASQFGVLRNGGEMDFSRRDTHPATNEGYAYSLGLGDFDGDGDLDPVVGCAVPGPLHVLDNRSQPTGDGEDGPLEFEDPQRIWNESFIRDVIAVDIDGDCDQDVIAVDLVANNIIILFNFTPQENGCGGPPGFAPAMQAELPQASGTPPKLIDVNKDGVIDGADLAVTLSNIGGSR